MMSDCLTLTDFPLPVMPFLSLLFTATADAAERRLHAQLRKVGPHEPVRILGELKRTRCTHTRQFPSAASMLRFQLTNPATPQKLYNYEHETYQR